MIHDDVAPTIRDEAKFFSPGAVQNADQRIREIYRRYDRDVLIETFATVPATDADKVKMMDAAQRNAYFLGWAKSRFKERIVNGVYILICKEPLQFEVGVEEHEPHKFAKGTRDAVFGLLRQEFKDNRFDEGLDQTLSLLEEKLGKKQLADNNR